MVTAIPITKTSCGETFSGAFSYINQRIESIVIDSIGSQLLDYICIEFIFIVKNRKLLYVKRAREIFWRMNKKEFSGSRKEMINQVFSFLSAFILERAF